MLRYTKIHLLFIASGSFLCGLSHAGIRVDFDRDNQTYNWFTGFNYSIYSSGFNFRTSFDGRSNLIKGRYNRWQENATTDFNSSLTVFKSVSFLTSGEYTINGLDRRRVRSSELAMGLAVKPLKYIEIKPMVHVDSKKRSELEAQLDDQGVGYGFTADLLPHKYGGAFLDARISYDKIILTNIPSETGIGYLNSTYKFRKSDTIYVSVRGGETAKRFYGPGGSAESITKQIKQEREADFIISVMLPADLRLKFDGNAYLTRYLYRGGIVYDATSAQRDNSGRGEGYEVSLGGSLKEIAFGEVIYRWSNASQDYQGLQLDQDTDTGEMSFHGKLNLTESDTISGDLVLGVASFSNPNKGLTQEDWDKKTVLLNGKYTHIFSRFFTGGLSGGVSRFHQIYVSGARSANNGYNDTYVLTPFVVWRPLLWLDIHHNFDIQANYITFDFDRKKVSTKNRIFRRASTRTQLFVRISENLHMNQTYYYRYEDYGQLIWDDGWQQAVSWDRRRNGLETEFIYDISGIVDFKPSFSWEKTGNYDHRPGKVIDPDDEPSIIRALSGEQVKMIFRAELIFKWNDRRNFYINVSHRLRKFNDRPKETNDLVRVSMEYLF
ncbi:MAG: hypothetical protein JSU85_00780 [Candidatus Zixiibacteriota bacterium]|nr:MAG: hypothetical protein JSU85_00780 [candidate division Zixibacteria bacterium]